MSLKIAPGLEVPDDAVTQTFALLAMRGAGKSTVLVDMAEEMTRAGLHWIAVDPKGDWWGIQSSADGKSAGLPVPVFGGRHGNAPLSPSSGALIAELLVREGISAVLDVSELTKNEQVTFLAGHGREDGFFGRLYRLKDVDQPPTHVFLEEAHEYLPQSVTKSTAKLHADASRISTMGRQRGLGSTLASQRSARVHKDVLTQTDTLIAMRNTSPQDRKAVADWVDYHGQSKEIVDSLPTLSDGEGWVVSPSKLGFIGKVRFRRRQTFDSGATPTVKVHGKRRPPTLAEIDFPAITAAMKEAEEELKASDPKELRKRIRELEKELQRSADLSNATAVNAERLAERARREVKPIEVPVLSEADYARLDDYFTRLSELTAGFISQAEGLDHTIAEPLAKILDAAEERLKVRGGGGVERDERALPASASTGVAAPSALKAPRPTDAGGPPGEPVRSLSDDLTGPQRRLLDALAWLEQAGLAPSSRVQVAMIARYHPRTKAFTNALSTLSTAGLVEYPAPGLVVMTESGRNRASWPEVALTSEELQAAVFRQIGPAKTRLLQPLIAIYPDAGSRDDLAVMAGYHPRTKAFTNGLSSLRSLGLIDYPGPGQVVALPVLFVEGRAA